MTERVAIIRQQIDELGADEKRELLASLEDLSDILVCQERLEEHKRSGDDGVSLDDAYASIPSR